MPDPQADAALEQQIDHPLGLPNRFLLGQEVGAVRQSGKAGRFEVEVDKQHAAARPRQKDASVEHRHRAAHAATEAVEADDDRFVGHGLDPGGRRQRGGALTTR